MEDDENDAELVRLELERGGWDLHWERVDSESALVNALEREWDVIVSDFAMPGFSGLRAFELYREKASDVPFIFVSGALGEERAVEAMRAGAKDYFLKGKLARLNAAVRRELEEMRNRRQRAHAELATVREQRRLALAIEAADFAVFELPLRNEGEVDYTGAWSHILGWEATELPAQTGALQIWLRDNIHPEDLPVVTLGLNDFLGGKTQRYSAELRIAHKTGRWANVAVWARIVARAGNGRAEQVAGVLLDLSGRKSLEAQLRQAQKMEAVGQLAGGVAHDFNNLLTAILSFGTFALEGIPPGTTASDDINEVLKAAERAQGLTSQLLAFSRRKPVAPRIVSANEVVESAEKILRRLIGADVDLRCDLAPDLWNVRMDTQALEQILLNLSVNARDAMPEGGRLSISTHNVVADGEMAATRPLDLRPGEYIAICVTDSGTGMDAATQARIFEPFFTTKDAGRGTGLGLSTCYGIVKQADGSIEVDSAPGRGSTFKVYLPRVDGPLQNVEPKLEPRQLHGHETILLVEDNDQVRQLSARALSRMGYKVIEASNGAEALGIQSGSAGHIDLLVTDVVMPTLGGRQLAGRLRETQPELRVLFMSGYSPAAISDDGVPQTDSLLQKPFTPDVLARRVRQVLDADPAIDAGHG